MSVLSGCPQGESRLSFVFTGDLAAVRIIGVFVIAGCPQGESRLSFVFIGDLVAVRIIGVSVIAGVHKDRVDL